jgi:hypothetical protein
LPDKGDTLNAHHLSADALKSRRIDPVDIVTDPYPPHKYKPEEDLTLYRPSTGRGPLKPGWLTGWSGPIVTSYKLAVIKFHSWPRFPFLEQRVQNYAWSYLKELQLVGHRKAVAWQDDWMPLSDAQLVAYESETRGNLETRWQQQNTAAPTAAGGAVPTHDQVSAGSLGPAPPPLALS